LVSSQLIIAVDIIDGSRSELTKQIGATHIIRLKYLSMVQKFSLSLLITQVYKFIDNTENLNSSNIWLQKY